MTPNIILALAGFSFAALTIAIAAVLKGWQGWLEIKRMELGSGQAGQPRSPAFERIEMADLKERIRKLESIASCVDL